MSRARQGTNMTASLKTTAPASFKPLLGSAPWLRQWVNLPDRVKVAVVPSLESDVPTPRSRLLHLGRIPLPEV